MDEGNGRAEPSAKWPARGWPLSTQHLYNPPIWFSSIVITFATIFGIFLVFLSVLALWRLAGDLMGIDPRRGSDAVKSILPIAAAAVGLPLIVWRLAILSRQTRTAEAKTQIDREAHYTLIFSRSVDQLGQTREINATKEIEGRPEPTTKTVPNIEVRLGGIHSLVRLSEESDRDRAKIENMLLSYVRENSWSDRSGASIAKEPVPSLSSFGWAFRARRGEFDATTQSKFAIWASESDKKNKRQLAWSQTLAESRVDVNEAIDAVRAVRELRTTAELSQYYECLFVGRRFNAELLKLSKFERCTFVNCRFEVEATEELIFARSHFIRCGFRANDAITRFSNCEIFDPSFQKITNSKLYFVASNIYDIGLGDCLNANIHINSSDFYKGWIDGAKHNSELLLNANYAAFASLTMANIKFAEGSKLKACGFSDVSALACDFDKVQGEPETVAVQMSSISADSQSIAPNVIARPETWAAFDPNAPDDEVPF